MLRFDQWMAQALYHPEKGYYSKRINHIGASGDFATTATLSSILGSAITSTFLSQSPARHMIEVGAGDGSLAYSVLRSLPWPKRLWVKYHIVDLSQGLVQQQKQRLGNKVHWHRDMKSALEATGGNAFIFSNELVDAFPARVFQRTSDALEELHIDRQTEHFITAEQPATYSSALADQALEQYKRIELHEAYYQWLESWIPYWHGGKMLTIDYGDLYPALYHRVQAGTVRAYWHHQKFTGAEVYANVGFQDITADVNFTDLISWGETLGLETLQYTNQREYLQPHIRLNNEADSFLTNNFGAGDAFKVLIQENNG